MLNVGYEGAGEEEEIAAFMIGIEELLCLVLNHCYHSGISYLSIGLLGRIHSLCVC